MKPIAISPAFSLRPLAIAVATALYAAHAAHAQSAQATTEPKESTLPEVTVSAESASKQADHPSEGTGLYVVPSTRAATGLGLSLRDTPQAATVITRQQIDDQGTTSVGAALQQSTGVSINPLDRGRNTMVVRGFKVENFQLDGMPAVTGDIGLETMDSAMFDRLEVVRGANGLLNGAGNPSASVNMVRKQANSKTFTGSVGLDLGSWQQRRATFDLTTPLNASGSVRARVVGATSAQNAFMDGERTRRDMLYAVINADLTPATELQVGASIQRDKRKGVMWYPLPYWYSDGSRTNWPRDKNTAADWHRWDTQDTSLFASIKHQFANRWTVRADVNHRRQNLEEDLLWFDGWPDRKTGQGLVATTYQFENHPKQTNINLQATGPFKAWGREHEATVGLMHDRHAGGWTNRDPVSAPIPVPDFNNWTGNFPRQTMGPRYQGDYTRTIQTALYGATRLQATDRLKIILGARLSNYRRHLDQAVWTAQPSTIRHNNVLTPYAGVVFDINTALSAYASTSSMFNPQDNRDRNGNYLDPVKGRSDEIGLKGEWLDGRMQATAALFRVKQSNFATPDVGYVVPGTTTVASRPAQGVRVKGFEIETTGQPMPGWNLSAGFTQFSARDAQGVDVLPYHPRKLLRVSTQHSLHALLPGLSAGASLNWQSRELTRAKNPGTGQMENIGEGARALVGVMMRYAPTKQWSVQLNVDNLFDKTYRTTNSWAGKFMYGEPRKVQVSARYNW